MGNTIKCPRCERVFHKKFDNPRFWHGGPYTESVGGEIEEYSDLCNDCHRDIERS